MNKKWIMSMVAVCGFCAVVQAEPDITVDFSKTNGTLRALHGVNNGPFVASRHTADLTAYHKAAGFPSVRLHDCNWPTPNVVDIPTIFPLFHADADDPKNYVFGPTDRYLAPIVANGADIVYRLGVSIEWMTAFHTYPPEDYEKWAKICVNIIRHYNEGWANGFHYNIKYYEIWNEPDLGDPMWRGTQQQYFELYRVASLAIKAHNPALKVGGPSAAMNPGRPIVRPFLAYCRDNKLPLDFFSWHSYLPSVPAFMQRAVQARALLNEYGFKETKNFCTEYRSRLQGNADLWKPGRPANAVREAFDRDKGSEAAAFQASAFLQLQDVAIDMAHFYTADVGPFSMFGPYGEPGKVYYAFVAFNRFMETPHRVVVTGASGGDGLTVGAGLSNDKKTAAILLSNFRAKLETVSIALKDLPWTGQATVEIWRIDDTKELQSEGEAKLDLAHPVLVVPVQPHTVSFVRIRQ